MLNKIKDWSRYYYDKLFTFDEFKYDKKKYKDGKLVDHVYHKSEQVTSFYSRMMRIHKWFKYILLIPGLHLAKLVLGKHLVLHPDDTPQHRDLRVFDTSFDDAIKDWHDYFIKAERPDKIDSDDINDYIGGNGSPELLHIMKRIMLTVCQNDTAYLEFLNILLYKLTINMNKEYNSDSNTIDHLFYTDKAIYNVAYFGLKKLTDSDEYELSQLGKDKNGSKTNKPKS